MPGRFDILKKGGTLTVGPYVLTFEIAHGSMGIVFMGYEEAKDRLVAIKFLKPDLCMDERIIELFHREAAATARLHHPNIVTIFEQGMHEGLPYFAMELIEGESLADIVKQELLNPLQGVDYLIQAASGLFAAWEMGHVHRDIKPENLLLNGKGLLKVTDFGCVTDLGCRPSEASSCFVLGTPHFMAPEQAQGKGVDCRSDIYSLGASFYYLFTGKVPFDGPSVMDVLLHQIHTPLPPMRSLCLDLPRALCWVIERMLAKSADDRYQTYAELLHDLEKLRMALHRKAPVTAACGMKRRRRSVDSTPETPLPLSIPTAA